MESRRWQCNYVKGITEETSLLNLGLSMLYSMTSKWNSQKISDNYGELLPKELRIMLSDIILLG
jgi:hypothetical protein